MTSLLQNNTAATITSTRGQYSLLEVAEAYHKLGEHPIPVCDPDHLFASSNHRNGYTRPDGTKIAACRSPGKAPLERNYGNYAATPATRSELVRMFGGHQGNIGGVIPVGRILIDVDPRSGGLDSLDAYVKHYEPLPWTPTAITGGSGLHYHLRLPQGVKVSGGGSLSNLGFPGIEWKGPGSQAILPPSVHQIGKQYQWEPGLALGQIELAVIPQPLLDLILNSHSSPRPHFNSTSLQNRGDYPVRPVEVQGYFRSLWQQVGVSLGRGDAFYVCPFHDDHNPSMHIDSERCVWYCFAHHCRGNSGGGINQLTAFLGPENTSATDARPSLVRRSSGSISVNGSKYSQEAALDLGHSSYPNCDGGLESEDQELIDKAKRLFPVPRGVKPTVIGRMYALVGDPTRAMRHQVISNTWDNPVNLALKRVFTSST